MIENNGYYWYQEKREDNTAHKQPPAGFKGDEDTAVRRFTLVEDLIWPSLGGQHGYGGEDIKYVDHEGLEHDDI